LIAAFLAECLGAVYLAFMTWLLSDWFISDKLAFRLTTAGWYRIGGLRLLCAFVLACLVSLFAYLFNRIVLARLGQSLLPRRLHWYFGALVAAAGFAGVIRFVIERPYI
jgi:hypothetical protein